MSSDDDNGIKRRLNGCRVAKRVKLLLNNSAFDVPIEDPNKVCMVCGWKQYQHWMGSTIWCWHAYLTERWTGYEGMGQLTPIVNLN